MNRNRIVVGTLFAVVVLFQLASAQTPSVPGFTVETYATVPDSPIMLSFDPTGVLYVGRNSSPNCCHKIYRIGAGGAPVGLYGNEAIPDPDSVAFDVSGIVAPSGSVLVGGGINATTAVIKAILPDQSVINAVGPTTQFTNPQDMDFDGLGRMIVVDQLPARIFAVTGGTASLLASIPQGNLGWVAVDGMNRIFTSGYDGVVRLHDSNGLLLDNAYVSGLAIAVGPGGPVWGSDLYVARPDGTLLRVDQTKNITVIGSGFPVVSDLEFGPNQSLYVSVNSQSKILVIATVASPGKVPPSVNVERVAPDVIRLTWQPSDCPGAQDYGIYEGVIGDWYSHSLIDDCFDAGKNLTEEVWVSPGDTYYLVVPRTASAEGSYGTDSENSERPVGVVRCAGSQVLGCP